MPVTVQGPDGQTYQFPDGTTKDVAVAYFKKKGIGTNPAPSTQSVSQQSSPLKPLAPQKPQQGFFRSLYENSPLSLPEGLYQAASHPGQALTGIAKELGRSGSQLREAWNTPNNEPMKAADRTLYAIPFVGGALKDADEAAKQGNWRQGLGTGLGLIGSEMLTGGLANMIPTRAKAGRLFEHVMSKAADEPVYLHESMEPLMRLQELADRGGTMPTAAGKLLNRINDPLHAAPTYREARDFASNLSGLSAGERGNLTPVMLRQAGELSSAFNKDVGNAAMRAGVLPEYNQAMSTWKNAMRIRGAASKAAKIAIPAAVGYGVAEKFLKPLIPER